jgi:hypothetical protein
MFILCTCELYYVRTFQISVDFYYVPVRGRGGAGGGGGGRERVIKFKLFGNI